MNRRTCLHADKEASIETDSQTDRKADRYTTLTVVQCHQIQVIIQRVIAFSLPPNAVQ